jgi:hypothetical protein
MTNLPSVPLVIDALGGNGKVAELAHTTGKVVSHWRSTGKFPANSYVSIHKRLKKVGLSAPDTLWAMRGAKKRRFVSDAEVSSRIKRRKARADR